MGINDWRAKRQIKYPERGVLRVIGLHDEHSHPSRTGNRIAGIITAPGMPATRIEHKMEDPARWAGHKALPVLCERTDPTKFIVLWEELESGAWQDPGDFDPVNSGPPSRFGPNVVSTSSSITIGPDGRPINVPISPEAAARVQSALGKVFGQGRGGQILGQVIGEAVEQALGQATGRSYGQPYGQGGQPYGQQPYGQGAPQPYDQAGQPYNQGAPQPYDQAGQPYNQGNPQPYDQAGQPYNQGNPQPYNQGNQQPLNQGNPQPHGQPPQQDYGQAGGQPQPFAQVDPQAFHQPFGQVDPEAFRSPEDQPRPAPPQAD
jgi:hypothetical protein